MNRRGHEFQVFNTIVSLISVLVMNIFEPAQFSANQALHQQAVAIYPPATRSGLLIRVGHGKTSFATAINDAAKGTQIEFP